MSSVQCHTGECRLGKVLLSNVCHGAKKYELSSRKKRGPGEYICGERRTGLHFHHLNEEMNTVVELIALLYYNSNLFEANKDTSTSSQLVTICCIREEKY